MKLFKFNVVLHSVGLLLLTCVTTLTFAQVKNVGPISVTTTVGPKVGGFLESLPSDYATSGKNYPVLIFTMGIGAGGTGSATDLETLYKKGGGYVQDQIRASNDPSFQPQFTPPWPTTFTVNGESFQFIVIVPQFNYNYYNEFPTTSDLNDVINYVTTHYRVDLSRIYLTGNSSGGGLVWDYVGSSSGNADRIAAIVPFSAVTFPTHEKATRIKYADVAVWAFHNENDAGVPPSFTTNFVKLVNQDPPPTIPAKLTLMPGTDHASWFAAYTRAFTDPDDGLNIYEWMLQYKRTLSKANAGLDQDLTLLPASTASTSLSGSGTGPNNTATSYSWTKVQGPNNGTITNANTLTPSLSGLTTGYYVYRLTITDNAGGTSTDEVGVTVYPQRYQAETTTSSVSTTTGTTTDEGGSATVLLMNQVGDEATYSVSVPSTGAYTLRLRTASDQSANSGAWADAGSTVAVFVDGNSVGDVFIPYSVSLTNFGTMLKDLTLGQGTHTLTIRTTRIAPNAGNTAINWLQLLPATVAGIPLPVNFALFNSNCADGSVNLLWKTASEINTKEFSVEKSNNGADWSSIGSVAASGSPTVERTYTFTDKSGASAYYRIVATDHDGRKSQTSIIRSNCSGSVAFNVYPNPVADKAIMEVNLEKLTHFRITILDSRGVVVRQQTANLPRGNSQVTLYMSGLPAGQYTLNARWDNETKSVKLIKN